MRSRPILFSGPMVKAILEGRKTQTRRLAVNMFDKAFLPTDVLWVRETWLHGVVGRDGVVEDWNEYHYRATEPDIEGVDDGEGDGDVELRADGKPRSPWKPSIHMPRQASRLTLPVTALRIEPLRDISETDAVAEGVASVAEYATLWDHLNAKRAAWWKNPLVFVITFEPHQINVDKFLEQRAAA